MSRYRTRSWRSFDPGSAPVRPERFAPQESLRILGLDPGSRTTGFGVIEWRGTQWAHVAHGCVAVPAGSLAERLRSIYERLGALIATHEPGEVAIERVFVNRNADSALKLGQARGAALCAIPGGLPVFEYAPRAVKLALVGSGAAEKPQVAHMIRALFGLGGRLSPDAADALAVAVCHAHSRGLRRLAAYQAALTPAAGDLSR